jgi:hypothetical protein
VRRILAAAALCLLAGLGAAQARGETISGTARGELLIGTIKADSVSGRAGPDRIAVEGGGVDNVRCGAGRDVVTADTSDRIAADCEILSLRVSRDPYRSSGSQHQTQVEPDSFSFGSTVVTTFQSGRYFDGGAASIGFATSTDQGRTWKSGFLPGVTQFSAPPGLFPRASDPAVAYDAAHGVWMIVSLGFSPDSNAMLVSRSEDGVNWEVPVEAVRSESDVDLDKEWIACDNWESSRFRGNCYLTYADFGVGRLLTQTSRDGGLTWSAPVPSPVFVNDSLNGAQPVVRPDGTVVILYSGRTTHGESISENGGVSFTAPITIANLNFVDVPRLRTSPFISVEVDAAGTIYAAWSDCGLRRSCTGDDVVLMTSVDGRTWSPPKRVPTGPTRIGRNYFMPGLAADPVNPGHLGIVYYDLFACACLVDVGFVGSSDGGQTWTQAQRLNARGIHPNWLARTTLGLMFGDYVSASFAGGHPVPVFALASPPSGRSLREATFVTSRGIGERKRSRP